MNSLALGRLWLLTTISSVILPTLSSAAEANPPPPAITITKDTNGFPLLVFPFPATEQYTVYGSDSPSGPFVTPVPGVLSGPTFVVTNGMPLGFYRVSAMPMTSNALLSATVLNRLTYGPSPADIERIAAIGPEAFIEEQLKADEIVEDLDTTPAITNSPPPPPPLTNWIRVATTGTTSSTNFFIHMSAAGRVYIDDVRLVLGTNADTGDNLLANGDFEDSVLTNGWTVGNIYSTSVITNSPTTDGQAASGSQCLLMIGSAAGSGGSSSIQQAFSPTNYPSSQRFTLSYSYLPVVNVGTNILTVRLSGSAATRTVSLPSSGAPPPTPPPAVSPVYERLASGYTPMNNFTAPPRLNTLADLRAYHVLHAVQSKRQLYEILVQFFENHLTTEYQKIRDWFDNFSNAITNDAFRTHLAVDLEWREHNLFRQALLNPNCNFHDLLKISIESPAMIIYLDTILSTRTAANENYARELLELHTFGADNGYVQQDIVELAKIWTGWRVAKKDISVANDPHARPVTSTTNDLGVWVLNFATNNHNYTSVKRLFTNVVVDARFGAGFGAGQPYGLTINANAHLGTNGIREGYLVLDHLANLPYTAEFLSVKLCRTFVHENFEFGLYDYTAPDLSPEAQLVKECMIAWNTPAADGRKGNIRSVLRAIFSSALFRGHAASQQKIKTPLEFAVSGIRALRLTDTDTNNYVSTTADTDGYAIASPLSRMGGMNLFNKAEPDGYSEFGRIWLSTANLAERMRYAQSLLMARSYGLKDDDYGAIGLNNTTDPAKLIRLKLPSTSWNDPAAIVDFFLGLLYPGEGTGNLGLDRQAAIDFLNANDAGAPTPGTPFNLTTHDGRLRGMVALLMCLPKFQEQ